MIAVMFFALALMMVSTADVEVAVQPKRQLPPAADATNP